MCKLNLSLCADPYGISIEETPNITCSKFEPKWAYEWQVTDVDWAEKILKLAKNRTDPANTEFITNDKMHCTSHVVTERDSDFEKMWFNSVENESVKFDKIFWKENVCALSAVLTESQRSCYLMTENTACHLSVSKAISQHWRDVGLFVKECLSAKDWVKVDSQTAESESVGAFKSN